MTQDGIRSDRQDRRQQSSLTRQRAVAHGVNPAMKETQPAALQAVADRSAPDPQGGELAPGHDSMLSVCERSDGGVRSASSKFGPYMGLNFELGRHGSIVAPRT